MPTEEHILLLLCLSGPDADLVDIHVVAAGVSGPPRGDHVQHVGGRPAVRLLPFKLQHQQIPDIFLRHQQERMCRIRL